MVDTYELTASPIAKAIGKALFFHHLIQLAALTQIVSHIAPDKTFAVEGRLLDKNLSLPMFLLA